MKTAFLLLLSATCASAATVYEGALYLKTVNGDTKFGTTTVNPGPPQTTTYTPSSVKGTVSMSYNKDTKALTFPQTSLTFTNFASPNIANYGEPQKGTFVLCFYQYGGFKSRSTKMGTLFKGKADESKWDGCFPVTAGNGNTIATKGLTAGVSMLGDENSIIGRGAALMKRTVAIIVYAKANTHGFTFKLQDKDGKDTGVSVKATKASETVYLNIPETVELGSYSIVAELDKLEGGAYVFGSNAGTPAGYYWKTFYFVTLDTTQAENGPEAMYSLPTADDKLAFPPTYNALASKGWKFPTAASLTQVVDPATFTPAAVGTVGVKKPGAGDANDATAKATTNKVHCSFDNSWNIKPKDDKGQPIKDDNGNDVVIARTIYGEVLLTSTSTDSAITMQAQVNGLQCPSDTKTSTCEHSFHFHPYGDIQGGDGTVPQSPPNMGTVIPTGYETDPLELPVGGSSTVYVSKTLPATAKLDGIVGLALTIHDGPKKESDTIAWGVCGIADSAACLRSGCPDWKDPTKQPAGALPGAASHATPLSALLVAVGLAVFGLAQ